MPGVLSKEWPAWPEMIREEGELDPENTKIKKEIAARYGEEALGRSWLLVCEKLESISSQIKEKNTSYIPDISYGDFFQLSEEAKDRLRSIGCFVIRNTIPTETAEEWYSGLKKYVADNKGTITGWPAETPYILELYWSQAQLEARTHPQAMALHHALNSLWHDDDDAEKEFAHPMAYADALRMRPPGAQFMGLGPHIDAGSLCRWDEPEYHQVYDRIWAGEPDKFDPFDLTHRKLANPAYHPGPAQSHVLRAFQGWTALTTAGANEGSLLIYPDVKWATAYVLLRPFFRPPDSPADVLDATKWTLDLEDPWFPGVWRSKPQELSPTAFPHLRLEDCLINIPKMHPGDTIWWHCDMCHAVETEHKGQNVSSVIYVAATPSTKINKEYMKHQAKDFLEGVSPEDFRGGCYEKGLKGFPGEAAILNEEHGRRAMGLA